MLRILVYDFGVPFTCFILFSTFIIIGIKSKKQILFNLSAIFIAIFIFEIYSHLKIQHTIDDKVSFLGSFYDSVLILKRKDFVGYGPKEDTSFSVTAIRKNNNSIIYNVTYSFSNGTRIVPNNNDTAKKQLFFLGCSHTFGDGLNDDQTLPFFINKHSNQAYNITNFGFSGYGTHQALKTIEKKIMPFKSLKKTVERYAVYSFIPAHFFRAAGYSIWDPYGPLYEFENNNLIYKGGFDKNRLFKENPLNIRLKTIWRNSYLYKDVFYPKVTEKDVTRVSEIINTMNSALKEANIRFIVILKSTNHKNETEQLLYLKLKQNKIEHYFFDEENITVNNPNYTIKGDGHPNEQYNSKMAKFILKKLKFPPVRVKTNT